eukprot:3685951-Rhodomonas_salina.5
MPKPELSSRPRPSKPSTDLHANKYGAPAVQIGSEVGADSLRRPRGTILTYAPMHSLRNVRCCPAHSPSNLQYCPAYSLILSYGTSGTVLRICYGMSSPDIGHAGTRYRRSRCGGSRKGGSDRT